ncbi:hypothetical protein Daus18300_009517 [Diaporthe australafricana]|uniref:Uncharacterized protein n=1 Tax=Diaporthe australafricana TaxID=127596 RepID=A0ABR3WE16_9PEZI
MGVILAILALGAICALAQTSYFDMTFSNKHRYYFDNDGNAIDSVNGKISWIDDQYFRIASPSVFDINDPVNAEACAGIFGGCGRPKVIFNELTKKFVFYGFGSKGFGTPGIPVFTSDTLTSDYKFMGNMIQGRWESGFGAEDLSLAIIDGKGYVIWTSFNMTSTIIDGTLGSIWPPFLQTVLIQQLTDDFLNGTGDAFPVIQDGGSFPVMPNSPNLIDGQVESPDLIKRGDTLYMIGSSTCAFCNGTLTLAYRANSIQGPWVLQIVDSGDTCGGQAMGVMTIPPPPGSDDSAYIYQADTFSSAPTGSSFVSGAGHSMWSLGFEPDGSISPIDCAEDAKFTFKAARSPRNVSTTGLATNATDGSGNFADYYSESGWPASNFYQTWTASKTGALTEVGVNLAANNPNVNMTIVVFRYPDEAALLEPFFKWEALGDHEVNSAPEANEVSKRHRVVRIQLNATVTQGDRLGLGLVSGPITNPDSSPWSYLLTDITNETTDHKLYATNRGRVSLGGQNGTVSPVFAYTNKELKWYALVD